MSHPPQIPIFKVIDIILATVILRICPDQGQGSLFKRETRTYEFNGTEYDGGFFLLIL